MSAEVTITLDREYVREAAIGIVLLMQAESNAPLPEMKAAWRYCVLEVLIQLIEADME